MNPRYPVDGTTIREEVDETEEDDEKSEETTRLRASPVEMKDAAREVSRSSDSLFPCLPVLFPKEEEEEKDETFSETTRMNTEAATQPAWWEHVLDFLLGYPDIPTKAEAWDPYYYYYYPTEDHGANPLNEDEGTLPSYEDRRSEAASF